MSSLTNIIIRVHKSYCNWQSKWKYGRRCGRLVIRLAGATVPGWKWSRCIPTVGSKLINIYKLIHNVIFLLYASNNYLMCNQLFCKLGLVTTKNTVIHIHLIGLINVLISEFLKLKSSMTINITIITTTLFRKYKTDDDKNKLLWCISLLCSRYGYMNCYCNNIIYLFLAKIDMESFYMNFL